MVQNNNLLKRPPLPSPKNSKMADDEFNFRNAGKERSRKEKEAKEERNAKLAEDPELAAMMLQSEQVRGDTLASTQNTVRLVKETINVADQTAATLTEQGEQLNRTCGSSERADDNVKISYDKARELKKYDGWFPVSISNWFTGGKKKGEDSTLKNKNEKLDKKQHQLEKEISKKESSKSTKISNPSSTTETSSSLMAGLEEGSKALDQERQINENLDDISAGLDHIQAQADNMNDEFKKQNITIERIKANTEHADYVIKSADSKIKKYA